MTTVISTVIALPYELARLPLAIVDGTLLNRLPETSGPRVRLDRTIGSADKLAGTLLRNRDIAERGVDRIERSEKLLAADRLEQEAEARREQASKTAAAGRKKATQKRKAAQDRAASGLHEADAAEARGKQQATAKAVKTAAAKKAAATKRAARRTATADQRKQRVESAAEAKKQTAQRKAKTELDDARNTKQSAADARADAERLSKLAGSRKQDRTQD
jgi:hypothetical protein